MHIKKAFLPFMDVYQVLVILRYIKKESLIVSPVCQLDGLVGGVCFRLTPHLLVDGPLVVFGEFLEGGFEIQHLLLDPFELGLSSLKLLVGLLQSPPLGFHVAIDLVETNDVDDPRAEACGGPRLCTDEFWVELFVLRIE